MLQGKTIVLGVSGGIAVYKAAALCSKLTQAGANVRVIMTESAAKFVAPLTFQALSRNEVMTDTFHEFESDKIMHIHTADTADLFVIAPATANIMAKMASGIGDDMLTTTLLATTAPVMAAPAMNVHMYTHPAVQHNMQILRSRGVLFLEPGEGQLACGYVGKGRLQEPEEIVAAIERFFASKQLLSGKRVLVTAGGTIERIDPVRYITNDSSGKMGYAIAEEARQMGADVLLVTAPTSLRPPDGVSVIPVQSAEEMLAAVLEHLDDVDIVYKTAAVADYRPVEQADRKIKKTDGELVIRLVKNPDILQTIGERKTTQFVVGFAAETNDVDRYAQEKLARKNCDMIVANDVTEPGAGFGTDTNAVRVFDRNGLVVTMPVQSKQAIARRLLELAAQRTNKQAAGVSSHRANESGED